MGGTMTETPRSEVEASVTRLLWREQARELPRAAWHALRRLLRREPRWYFVVDGHVVARMVSASGHERLLGWVTHVHGETFRMGVECGKGVARAQHDGKAVDSGDASTP